MSKQLKQSKKYYKDTPKVYNTRSKRNIVTPFKDDNDDSNYNTTDISRNNNNKKLKIKQNQNISQYNKPSLLSSQSNMLWRALTSSDPYNGAQMIQHVNQNYNIGNTLLSDRIASIYLNIENDLNWHQASMAENSLQFAMEHCITNTYYKWNKFESKLDHSTTLISDDNKGIINLTMIKFTLKILSKLLESMINDEDLMNRFFENPDLNDVHRILTKLSNITGIYWNSFRKYLGIDGTVPKSTDPNMPVRARQCLEAFGKSLYLCGKIYVKMDGLNSTVAYIIKNNVWSKMKVPKSKNTDTIQMIFVCTLTNGDLNMNPLQLKLIELFDIKHLVLEL